MIFKLPISSAMLLIVSVIVTSKRIKRELGMLKLLIGEIQIFVAVVLMM